MEQSFKYLSKHVKSQEEELQHSLLLWLKCSVLVDGRLPLGQHQLLHLRSQGPELGADSPGLLVLLLCVVGLALRLLLLPALTLAHQLLHHQALVGRQQLLLLLQQHMDTGKHFSSLTHQVNALLYRHRSRWRLQLLCLNSGYKQSEGKAATLTHLDHTEAQIISSLFGSPQSVGSYPLGRARGYCRGVWVTTKGHF